MTTSPSEQILIVEDERLIRLSLRSRLEREGFRVTEAENVAEARSILRQSPPDLILLDNKLPDGNGLSLLHEITEQQPGTAVILMTAYATVESVVEAMRLGAYTYLDKPFEIEDMVAHVKKGLESTALRRELDHLRRAHSASVGGEFVVTESQSMRTIMDDIRKINQVPNSTVLLRGENGTGKDLLARYLHRTSVRWSKPLQHITCTALPDTLLESELFGHEKGAFTDAHRRKLGLLELADQGTVFLDEVGDLSPALQAKLLRFLEERTVRRVGGLTDIRVDVRIIAATNRDLEKAIANGSFRKDLFYRLSVVPVSIPPLRERPEDIRPLSMMFIDRFNNEFNKRFTGLSDEALVALREHPWPGNVRELRNALERALILGSGPLVLKEDLPQELSRHGAASNRRPTAPGSMTLPKEGVVLEDVERDLVIQALERTGHNQSAAARLLGLSRDQIRYRIEKFALAQQGRAL